GPASTVCREPRLFPSLLPHRRRHLDRTGAVRDARPPRVLSHHARGRRVFDAQVPGPVLAISSPTQAASGPAATPRCPQLGSLRLLRGVPEPGVSRWVVSAGPARLPPTAPLDPVAPALTGRLGGVIRRFA